MVVTKSSSVVLPKGDVDEEVQKGGEGYNEADMRRNSSLTIWKLARSKGAYTVAEPCLR
jgi:hypothetical protein